CCHVRYRQLFCGGAYVLHIPNTMGARLIDIEVTGALKRRNKSLHCESCLDVDFVCHSSVELTVIVSERLSDSYLRRRPAGSRDETKETCGARRLKGHGVNLGQAIRAVGDVRGDRLPNRRPSES